MQHATQDQRHQLTVFRSRLADDAGEAYTTTAAEMEAAAWAMPGFLEFKTFAADDGERVTLVLFDSVAHQAAWAREPRHRDAQAQGRERFYDEYDLAVCELVRRWHWTRG